MSVRRPRLALPKLFTLFLLGSAPIACSTPPPAPDGGGGQGGEPGGPPDGPVIVIRCDSHDDCDDQLPCNGVEKCQANECQAGEPVRCDDEVRCTRDYCEAASGECVNVPPDRDGDGEYDAACKDQDGEPFGADCDDEDPARFPGNTEVCAQDEPGHDEDCDPATFGELDRDRDGYTDRICENEAPKGKVNRGEDCDDTDRSVNPDTSEVCDGFDNNCDGEVDEGLLIVGLRDEDGDGYGIFVKDQTLPGYVVDEDGRLLACAGTPAIATRSTDCDDKNPLIRPDMPELCDGIDNNCDDLVDVNVVFPTWYIDQDGDGFGNPQGPLRVSCEPQIGYSLYPEDCNDLDAAMSPLRTEVCDAKDNDCDGAADFYVSAGNTEDDDQDGAPDPACGIAAADCDEGDPDTHPGAPELCDGKDNDCNGAPDTQVQSLLWYIDKDGDGWGNPLASPVDSCDKVEGRVTKVGDCDDRDPTRNPGRKDDCSGVAGSDDNCDGVVDEDEAAAAFFRDEDGDGYGETGSEPVFACVKPAGWAAISSDCDDADETVSPDTPEVCDFGDGVDDDCDGAVDCADSECVEDEGCAGLFQVKLTSPASPVVGIVATPFEAKFSVEAPNGTPVANYALALSCKDGAYSPSLNASTDASGEVSFTIYPGPGLGNYECLLTGATTVPFTLRIQAIAPAAGTVQPIVNLARATGTSTMSGVHPYAAALSYASAIDADTDGTLYVAHYNYGRLYRLTPRGALTDILAEIDAKSIYPTDIALDREARILYVLDGSAQVVYAYDIARKSLNQVAGGGTLATFSPGMSAREFKLVGSHHIAVAPGVGVVIADSSNLLFLLLKPDGTLGNYPALGPDKPSIYSCYSTNCTVALTRSGSLLATGYFATPASSNVLILARTLRGDSSPLQLSYPTGSGAELPLSQLTLGAPRSMALDPAENLLLVQDDRVRWIGRKDLIARDLIGGASAGTAGDYGPASAALLTNPVDAAMDGQGNVWVLEGPNATWVRRIWKPSLPAQSNPTLTLNSAEPTAFVGHPSTPVQVKVEQSPGTPLVGASVLFRTSGIPLSLAGPSFTGSGGLATQTLYSAMAPGKYTGEAQLLDLSGQPASVANYQLTVAEPSSGTISTIANVNRAYASSGVWANGPFAPALAGYTIDGLVTASDGTVYFSSYSRLFRLSPSGALKRIGGGGNLSPDNVPALSADLGAVSLLALDEEHGRLFSIRTSTPYSVLQTDLATGNVVTLAGLGSANPEGGAANQWQFPYIYALTVSEDGNRLYLQTNAALYEIDLAKATPTLRTLLTAISDVAQCTPNTLFQSSAAVSLGKGPGNLIYGIGYVCDGLTATSRGHYLYSIDPTQGPTERLTRLAIISTSTSVRNSGMALGPDGSVFFANYYGHSVYRWKSGVGLSLIAGTGTNGSGGDLGPANEAQLSYPNSVGVTPEGDVIIADSSNYAIRRVWLH